jgi:hypothetical protein
MSMIYHMPCVVGDGVYDKAFANREILIYNVLSGGSRAASPQIIESGC